MFNSARLKLTAWYLVIIMTISVLFSLAIYFRIANDLNRDYQRLSRRLQERRPLTPPERVLESESLNETKERVKLNLLYINLVILAFSASAGYFLAGRTLKPIKIMVEEQDRFITDASHELRTPLTALKTSIEVNLRDKNLSLKEAKSLLKSNLVDVNNLQSLSDNLLILSKKQNTKKNYFEKISVAEIIDRAIEKVAPAPKTKNIKIKKVIKPATVLGNKEDLIRVLVIFLDNAIKYSKKSGKVNISTAREDHKVQIRVEDQGIGIDEKDLPHIFERFYRGSLRFKADGYGLGLSIAKKIIDEHKGDVEVKSQKGKGTMFTLTLQTSR